MTEVIARGQKSTIVRMFAAPLPVRAAFRVLDVAAPEWAARRAERLWFTLPRPRPAAPTEPVDAPRVRYAVEVNGHTVVGDVWGTGPRTVYALHGWAGYRGQLEPFVAPLVARGYRVVTLDAPSHGESAPGAFGPRSSSIPEFADALTAVAARHGRPYALIAHSLGATAAACALCDGLPATRVVLLAPMASALGFARQFAQVLGLGRRTFRRLVRRVEKRVGAPMHHFDVPELGRAIAMPPTLVIHDRGDVSTPVSDGAAIAAAWPSARLHVTTGLGHRRMLSAPTVVDAAVTFIDS
jgi:pimeloyl-ACP methyl ester carboxylesterase